MVSMTLAASMKRDIQLNPISQSPAETGHSTGAVICAAGLSSRMRNFKPMLYIGGRSMIGLIVDSFRAAGVSPIVVVTGYKASCLRQHLEGSGVIFVHNPDYATTHMYDSFLMGLNALDSQCDRFFFTPADVPLFHTRSLQTLLEHEDSPVSIPTFQGKCGHPVLISASCIPYLRQYNGQGGLRGAMRGLSAEPDRIEVEDEGILLDADNDNDYYNLLKKERQLSGRGKLRFDLGIQMMVTEPFFSSSSAQLLELIDKTGSIQTASDCMHISYTTAWKTINHIEQQLGYPVLNRRAGGQEGGGSRLTDKGAKLLQAYRDFYSKVQEAGEQAFKEFFVTVQTA